MEILIYTVPFLLGTLVEANNLRKFWLDPHWHTWRELRLDLVEGVRFGFVLALIPVVPGLLVALIAHDIWNWEGSIAWLAMRIGAWFWIVVFAYCLISWLCVTLWRKYQKKGK